MNEQLKIIISAETAKLKQAMSEAKAEVQSFKQKVDAVDTGKIDDNFKKLGGSIKGALKGAATALAGISAALVGTAVATEEYRVNQAKLNTAFEMAGASAGTANKVYSDLYKTLGDSDVAVEAANHLAQITTNEKDLADWTTICTGVYATFGDSLPIEGLTESANETAKVGQVTGSLADALNWAGISEDEFNKKLAACNSEQERAALIQDTLMGKYSASAKKFEENNKVVMEQREAQMKLQAALADVGAAITPLITAFTNFAGNALAKVAPYLADMADNLLPKIQTALDLVSAGLEAAFNWATQHQALLATLAVAIGIIVTAIGLYNAVAAVKAALAAAEVTSVWALVSAYAAQAVAMAAALAPYLLIAAAIAAVIAIIVLCVKHWDEIKAKVIEVAGKIKETVLEMKDKVVEFFTNLKEKISEIIDNIKSAITEKWNAIKTFLQTLVLGIVTIVTNAFNNAKTNVQNAIELIKSVVNTVFTGIKSIIQTITNGIKTHIQNVFGLIKGIFTGDLGAIKTSVSNIFNNIKSTISSVMNTASSTVKTAINKIKGFMNFSWSLPKLKMPKISITGKFSLNPPSTPKFSISWHQFGGVFDNPTLFPWAGGIHGLGENGAEAIVPLEKNTQWLDRMASMLNEKMGGGTPVILQVDGKTFAQTCISTMNDLTRQTGSLPLKLV